MEAILAIPSPDRGRDFVLPLSLGGVRVRAVVQSGNQLVAEVGREPADLVLLPETLPDGPAEVWLAKVAAVAVRRPVAVVLIYGVEAGEAVRERVRAAYGPSADVVAAGARPVDEVASEAARVADRLAGLLAEQDKDAYVRLKQPVPPGTVPQPVRTGGAVILVGASGGVGTSTLAANLAAYAAMAGQRVLVVDAQFATAGGLAHHFGVEPDDQNHGLHHLKWGFMSSSGSAREALADEVTRRLEPVRFRGVRHAEISLLGVPAIMEQMTGLPVEQVLWGMQVLERQYDLVLVDCGAGIGSARTLKLVEQAGRTLLVAGGWGAGVAALARGLAAMEGKPGMDRLFLLLREAGDSAYGARTVRSLVNLPIYGRVPEEPLLRKQDTRLGMRLPLVVEQPESAYGRAVAELAFALGLAGKADAAAAGQQAGGKRGWLRFGSRGG
jgi:MinD-like ATPase involved in chromosome partitioning or flagellar assembly